MEILFFWTGAVLTYLGGWILQSGYKIRHFAIQKNGQVVGFSTGPNRSKPIAPGARPAYRAVLRFVGIDGLEYFLIESTGRAIPIYSMGEFVPIFLSRLNKKQVYLKVGGDRKLGLMLFLAGGLLISIYLLFFHGTLFDFLISGALVILLGLAYNFWSKSARFDWRTLFNKGEDLAALVPPEVVPVEEAKNIPWAQNVQAPLPKIVKRRNPWFWRPLFLVLSMLSFSAAAWLYLEQDTFLASAQVARGRVTYIRVQTYRDLQLSAPVVTFYGPNRKVYSFLHPIRTTPSLYKKGQEVRVLYDKTNPTKAQIDLGEWNQWPCTAMFALGIFFFMCARWALLYAYKVRNRKINPLNIRRVG